MVIPRASSHSLPIHAISCNAATPYGSSALPKLIWGSNHNIGRDEIIQGWIILSINWTQPHVDWQMWLPLARAQKQWQSLTGAVPAAFHGASIPVYPTA